MGTSKRSKIELNEYFQIGHLYEYKMNKLSQIKENGGIITKTYMLNSFTKQWSFGVLEKSMLMEDIQNHGEEISFLYTNDSVEILKKIS